MLSLCLEVNYYQYPVLLFQNSIKLIIIKILTFMALNLVMLSVCVCVCVCACVSLIKNANNVI